MTELRLVESEPRTGDLGEARESAPRGGLFETELPLRGRLPRGRHGIPADLVAAHQRQRLVAAMGEALAEHGYGRVTAEHVSERAGVSSRTFYKHFGNLWDCLLAAYEAAAEQLCERIEAVCAAGDGGAPQAVGAGPPSARLAAGIDAALAFLCAEPPLARLLGCQPPLEAPALAAARRHLVAHLAAMLRRGRGPGDDTIRPPGLDERMIDAALSFVSGRIASGRNDGLARKLGPELTELLAGPRRAA